jgi:coiled-coil domain-containing protein 61
MSDAATLNEEFSLQLRGSLYLTTVNVVEDECLSIIIEKDDTGEQWKGEFSTRYVEDVTQRTGNSKKFSVFTKMLLSALHQSSDSVYVDILTFADLEALRTKAARKAPSSSTSSKDNNKRYLILTYAAEFDKVNYPLPLSFVEEPSAQDLKAIVTRLRAELQLLRKSGSRPAELAVHKLEKENASLKAQVRQMERAPDSAGKARAVEIERDDLRANLESLRAESKREIETVRAQCKNLMRELEEQAAEMEVLRSGMGSSGGPDLSEYVAPPRTAHICNNLTRYKRRIRLLESDLESEKASAREEQAALRVELVALSGERTDLLTRNDALSDKLRALKTELESLKRRYNVPASRDIYTANPRPQRSSRSPSPAPPRPARPSSAGSATSQRASSSSRFDPTAYVKQRQAALQRTSQRPQPAAAAATSRNASALSSAASSRGGSVNSSRASSASRQRPDPPRATAGFTGLPASRSRPQDHYSPVTSTLSTVSARLQGISAHQRQLGPSAHSPSATNRHAAPAASRQQQQQSYQQPSPQQRPATAGTHRPSDLQRAAPQNPSPARGGARGPPPPPPPPSPPPLLFSFSFFFSLSVEHRPSACFRQEVASSRSLIMSALQAQRSSASSSRQRQRRRRGDSL